MKQKEKKVVRGMPTAVVISILIHTGLFLLAGMFVVFTVVKQKEVEFEPPKAVERPKMKLKKPKVRVKKSTKPKATTRIVTRVQKTSMPDIQLPEMSGIGESLGGGIGGFDLMPDLGEVTVFGSGQTVGNDLVGTFYDFKRDRKGKPLLAGMDTDKYMQELMRFLRNDWKPSIWSHYYRSPKKLYATTIMIPPILSTEAPTAFGEPQTGGWCWAVHYKGQLVYKDDITFRFWGFGDDEMFVRVDGELVLVACWKTDSGNSSDAYFSPLWTTPDKADSRRYWLGNNKSVVGDWITLKAGEPVDMEVLIGEKPGGVYCAMLLVEVQGVEYPKNRQGAPILPIFKTAYPSWELQDAILKDLGRNEACVTNGPIFSDYETSVHVVSNQVAEVEPTATNQAAQAEKAVDEMRTWTLDGGKSVQARFVAIIGKEVVLKDPRGRQKKIPLERFSEADRNYIELEQPPEFNIDFAKLTSQWTYPPSPYSTRVPPTMFDYTFKAKLKQVSTGDYDHDLKVEIFAVGKQYSDDNSFVLLTREDDHFVPAKQENRLFSYSTKKKVTLHVTNIFSAFQGTKYYGYLVVVTDERGEIIQHAESNAWLFNILDNLRTLPVGSYFNKSGKRIHPTQPRSTNYDGVES